MKRFFVLSTFLLLVVIFATQQQEEKTHSDFETTQTRGPASIKSVEPQKRDWVGNKTDVIQTGKITFENKPTPQWQQKLIKSLKRGLESDIEVTVENERDLIVTKGTKALNVQQVIVVFQSPRKRSSYRAMVDSANGKVIRTWDHTIHENFGRNHRVKLTAFPLQN